MKIRAFVLFGLVALAASHPGSAWADPIYSFTNTSSGPVSRADFAIIPAGSVMPPIVGTDPTTGQPTTASPVNLDTTQSSGFDFNNFSTALGTGIGVQGLRLLFGQKQEVVNGQITFVVVNGPNGEAPRYLDPGGTVTFALHLDPAFNGVVALKSLTVGVPDATLLPAASNPPTNGGGGTDTPPNIPEPATVALWGVVMAGFGLRKFRLPWQRQTVGA